MRTSITLLLGAANIASAASTCAMTINPSIQLIGPIPLTQMVSIQANFNFTARSHLRSIARTTD